MCRKKKLLLILVVLSMIIVGCSFDSSNDDPTDDADFEIGEGASRDSEDDMEEEKGNSKEEKSEEVEGDEMGEKNPIQSMIAQMTLEEKIGQLVMPGIEGYETNKEAKTLLDEYHVGGFIILGENVENTGQLLKLTNDIKAANSGNKFPLFLAIDEEGGRISRMPEEFVDLPTTRDIGKLHDPDLSYEIGQVLAKQVQAFGLNINFAPVLDIDSNPDNPVIGDRSFGPSPAIVSELGIAMMKGIESEGIMPVVKHFPGHGDTKVDSHIGLPIVKKDIENLMNFELIPFIEAINQGADAVMVAHILYEEIDPSYPATLSKQLVEGLLRDRLGFDGLIITDDLTMGAIEETFDIGNAAVLSIAAGNDIVLVAHEYGNAIEALEALQKAVETGELSEERIDESVYRILHYKEKYDVKDEKVDSISVEAINQELEGILDKMR